MINFCTGQSQWWDAAASIFADCVDLASLIGKVKFKHCYRSANFVAHELASYSFCNKYSSSWVDDPPDCIVDKLLNDVSVF